MHRKNIQNKIMMMRKSACFLGVIAVFLRGGVALAGNSVIGQIGDMAQIAMPAYAAGLAVGEQGWDGVAQFAYSFGATQLTVWGLKATVYERRPHGSGTNSFPSGHTASTVASAAFIHRRYGWKMALVPYAVAGYTAFSRVYTKNHYIHDCIAGAAIAGLWNWVLVDRYPGVSVYGDTDGAGVRFRFSF